MRKLFVVLFIAVCSFNADAVPVNVNSADAKTISEALSGIGLKKAEAIVKYREAKGEFKSVDDLVNVDGIGPKTLEKIKADILLSDAVADAKAEKKPDVKAEPAADKKSEAKTDGKPDKAK